MFEAVEFLLDGGFVAEAAPFGEFRLELVDVGFAVEGAEVGEEALLAVGAVEAGDPGGAMGDGSKASEPSLKLNTPSPRPLSSRDGEGSGNSSCREEMVKVSPKSSPHSSEEPGPAGVSLASLGRGSDSIGNTRLTGS